MMDMLIVLLVLTTVGFVKAVRTGGLVSSSQPILNADGSIEYNKVDGPPVGNNYRNLRETEPFTFILRQLGLKR